jgi:diacylglycerol kinase (ATP)
MTADEDHLDGMQKTVTERFVAIVNPAAGGGKCGRLAAAALDRVRQLGIELDVRETSRAAQAIEFAGESYRAGSRNFLAVGGDGTAYEIINGLFPEASTGGRPSLGFLPLGTGNSFLRDFGTRGVENTIEALRDGRRRACDVIRLRHSTGEIFFMNLLSLGFPAEVGETANRRFKGLGELGYILAVFRQVINLDHSVFPHRLDNSDEWNRTRNLFLTFSNSKYTGGKMMIAPKADPSDGLIEYVRWGPIGRAGLIWTLPRLFTGTHINHPLAARAGVKRVEFKLPGPVNVMVDGESLHLDCESLEILPSALDVIV